MHFGFQDESDVIFNELLVLRCQRSDRQAFEELIRCWETRLFYYVRRLVPTEEDAWDVLQQTWVGVVRNVKTLRDGRRLQVWLYRVARNTAMTHFRDTHAERERREDREDFSDIEQPEPAFTPEDAEEVHHALGRLPLPFREALTLHFIEGLSVAEIAEVIGAPEGTVKSRLHHAKRALRQTMTKGALP